MYDSESLEDFDLKQYLSVNEQQELDQNESRQLTTKSILKQKEKRLLSQLSKSNINYSNSSFVSYYLNYLDTRLKCKLNLNIPELDDKVSNAFRLVVLPVDWTLLGQHCYLNKCLYISLILVERMKRCLQLKKQLP